MKTYEANVERDGRFWLIRIAGVGNTQARNLRELDAMAKDLIAIVKGVDPERIEVHFDVRVPTSARCHLERAEKLRAQSTQANSQAAQEVRAAARELSSSGMPLRDIGAVLGVSYQRAHQLVKAGP